MTVLNDKDLFLAVAHKELAAQSPGMHAMGGFSDAISAIVDKLVAAGKAIPWGKVTLVVTVVLADLKAGKSVADIVTDVLAALGV